MIIGEVDYYYVDIDSDEYTIHRVECKLNRYKERIDVSGVPAKEMEENIEFMRLLRLYMVKRPACRTRHVVFLFFNISLLYLIFL